MFNQGTFAIDRMATTIVPQATTFDLGFGYRNKKWDVSTSITNIFDKAVYNSGSINWIDPKFPLTAEVSFARKF